jgi:hypothetical protein
MRAFVVAMLSLYLAGCGSAPMAPDPPPPEPVQAPTEGPLSGRWVGSTAEGLGLITYSEVRVNNCSRGCVDSVRNYYDVVEATLSHQGTRLTGTLTTRFAGADYLGGFMSRHIPASFDDSLVKDVLNMSVTPSGGVSVAWADSGALDGGLILPVNHDLTGTYTANTITVTGEREEVNGGSTERWSIEFRLRRP